MAVLPACTEAIGDVLDDAPVRPAAFERLEHLVKALDSPLGAGERAFFFEARARRQYDVGILAARAEEDVLRHEELELGQPRADKVRVGIDKADLFPAHVHRLE